MGIAPVADGRGRLATGKGGKLRKTAGKA